jgi:hypothetical protein
VTAPLTPTTRELACLALGHEDADEPACTTSDDQLVAELVEEVQSLRVAAGIVEETATDRAEADGVLVDVLDEVLDAVVVPIHDLGPAIRVRLVERGWTLHPVHRP